MGDYYEIREKLPPMRKKAYDLLHACPGSTAAELVEYGELTSTGGRGLAGNMSARLGELVDQNVATVRTERRCAITGNMAYEYWPTYGQVRPLKKPRVGKTLLGRLNKLKTKHPEHAEAIETVARLLQEG